MVRGTQRRGRLSGKRIVITGAAQGIGLAIAKACLDEEASLILLDRDGDLLGREVAALGVEEGQLFHAEADITEQTGIAAAIAKGAEAIGQPNALINNAGVNVFSEPLSISNEEWDRCFDINLKGAWNCCRTVLPLMIEEGGGAILNIASTHAFTIIPSTFPYPLAKHALLGLTKSLAIEYAGRGVRVNALAPGYVETQKVIDYWNSFADPKAAKAETMKLHPQGRIARPEEIALAAVFMISDECRFMNAACLTIDGGLSVIQHQ
ncbi:SDR family oxidoreductase [Oryzifoliimicrobium ureilyticus]|uniref:SDR family oxidoreductase n=1 Tax=Oryzifoliimicrobium ureilyticus TaxID=3113724 RepID=UPI0030766276